MSLAALGLVAAAAIMHVGWNALAKRAQNQFVFVWAAIGLSAVAMLPAAVWFGLDRGIATRGLWPLAASCVVHAIYFYSLGRAYSLGDLSQVYPIARGLSVVLVAVAGWLILDEHLPAVGIAGITFVVAGVLAVGLDGKASREAMRWAALTAALVASYSLIDKVGVASLHPVVYVTGLGLGSTAVLVPVMLRRRGELAQLWRAGRRDVIVAAALSLSAYLLVLMAFNLSSAAYVVATRELSIVASIIVGRALLSEAPSARRVIGAAVIVAGVATIVAV